MRRPRTPNDARTTTTARRGFSLATVLFVLAVMTAAIGAFIAVVHSSATTTASMIDRRRVFYMCDGTARLIAQLGQQYLAEVPGAPTTGLQPYVCEKGGSAPDCTGGVPNLVEQGFVVNEMSIAADAAAPVAGIITEGPLSGMQAQQLPIRLFLDIERFASGARCTIDQELTLASIGLFQFFLFSDDDTSWVPAPISRIQGRIHVNGDLCIGGHDGMFLSNAFASGRIMNHLNDGPTQCRASVGSTGGNVCVWNGTGTFPTTGAFPSANCPQLLTTNDATNGSWSAAPTTWNNRLLDGTYNVKALKLPVAATALVQPSREADGATTYDNSGTSRLLVDPVRGPDPADVRAQKFACKADIRIINGVWYVRQTDDPGPSDPCGGWPGTPVWSDHPGTLEIAAAFAPAEHSIVGAVDVGQADLATAHGWAAIGSGINTPKRFSPYRFDRTVGNVGKMVVDADMEDDANDPTVVPVLTYGAITKSGSGTHRSAHWLAEGSVAAGNATELCGGTTGLGAGDKHRFRTTTSGACNEGAEAAFLDAARQGFADPQVMGETQGPWSASERKLRSRILPVNFDVAAFRAALKTCTVGELGSFFPGTCGGSGREFNGIVWISTTWDQSLAGFGSTTTFAGGANVWPNQGDVQALSATSAPRFADSFAAKGNRPALPYPLCAGDAAYIGQPMTTGGGSVVTFKVPSCAATPQNESGVRPQAIRVINASTVGNDVVVGDPLPDGLTIASNILMYVVGDANTDSIVATSTSTPWVPFMVAGDHVRLLSDAWTDEWAPWGQLEKSDHDGTSSGGGSGEDVPADPDDGNASKTPRQAVDTTYNMQILAGHPLTSVGVYSGGIENFPGFLEDWNGINARITGAFVKGYGSVYMRYKQHGRKDPPLRPWTFDPHLEATGNQPPGTPRYDVQAMRVWRRE